jgi:glycerol-3-phosphate dehydrogenase
VLAEAAVALGPAARPESVRATFAGLRVLPGAGSDTAGARRETIISRGAGGMVSVAGGKLTTYRRIALDALDTLRADLGLRTLDRRPRPLPGAVGLAPADARLTARFPALEPAARAHLLHLYGSLAEEVLAEAEARPELLERLHPEAPDLVAQAEYAWSREWATRPEDVTRRRTTLALRGLDVRHRLFEVTGTE